MNKFDRRGFLTGTAGAAGLVMLGGLAIPARAAGPINVGVLIPGSKSDKGWMESGYDGMKAAEKKLGTKVAVKFIENVKFGDMEQVLVTLAGKNELVIGIGGQTQASVFKVAPRFPKVKFATIGGNADPKKPDNVSGYDVRQAEIAFAAGAAAAMLSKTGAVSNVGGLEIPAILEVTCRKWEKEKESSILLVGWDAWVRGVMKFVKTASRPKKSVGPSAR